MKHLHTFESFMNEAYKPIPATMKISGKFVVTIGGQKFDTKVAGFERENDNSDALYLMDEDPLKAKHGSFIVMNSDMPKLSKGQEVNAVTTKDGQKVKLKRVDDL